MTIRISSIINSSFSHINQIRLDEIKSKIQGLESKMGIQTPVAVSIGEFKSMPCALLRSNTIKLPPWFLLKYEDIPDFLRVSRIDDPRLADVNFLNSLANWMNQKFQDSGISCVVRSTDYGILQTAIKLIRDRDLYEKSKDFTLAHELAHLNYSQVGKGNYYLYKVQETISAAGIISGIGLLVLALSIIPYVNIAVSLVVGGIGVTISIATLIKWLNQAELSASPTCLQEEKNADMDAVEVLQDARGGIHFFDTLRNHNLSIRRSNPSGESRIDHQGNNLTDKTHPLLVERIAYLQQWQTSHLRS